MTEPAKTLAQLAREQGVGPVVPGEELPSVEVTGEEHASYMAAIRECRGDGDARAWPNLRQEYLADLIEESLRREHGFLRRTHIRGVGSPRMPWRRKPRIPDGLFAYFADQAAWHVIRRTQIGAEGADGQ